MSHNDTGFISVFVLVAVLGGCADYPAQVKQEPSLSPMGSGLVVSSAIGLDAMVPAIFKRGRSDGGSESSSLYQDQRISRPGDIITVTIAIDDKATFGNSTDRSKTAKANFVANLKASLFGLNASPSVEGNINSTSSTQGQGAIDRSEKIQVSIAAVVNAVLPNRNLVISGRQEIRVNSELRILSFAGIVRPADISRTNTVSYDRVAEARISYGGRGGLSDEQTPAWGQQVYDTIRPF